MTKEQRDWLEYLTRAGQHPDTKASIIACLAQLDAAEAVVEAAQLLNASWTQMHDGTLMTPERAVRKIYEALAAYNAIRKGE